MQTAAQCFQQNNSFIALCRRFPQQLDQAFTFELPDACRMRFLATGVLLLEPTTPNQLDLLLSCGVHGNETAPMEMLDELIRDIYLGKLAVRCRTLIILGNPLAMCAEQRYVDTDLNRLFGKTARTDNYESRRAAELERYVTEFYQVRSANRLHYDLHTAIRSSLFEKFAIYPWLPPGQQYEQQQLDLLAQAGMSAMLLYHKPAYTFSSYSCQEFAAISFTLELGKVKPFGENDMSNFADMMSCLRGLLTDSQPASATRQSLRYFRVKDEIIRQNADFTLHFANDIPNFTPFAKGTLLATDGKRQYHVAADDDRIIFPNAAVELGQRALVLVDEITDLATPT